MSKSTLTILNSVMNSTYNTHYNTSKEITMPVATNYELNANSLASSLTAILFHELDNPSKAVLISCALAGAVKKVGEMDMPEIFLELLEQNLEEARLTTIVSGNGAITRTPMDIAVDVEATIKLLVSLGLITEDGSFGEKLEKILGQRQEGYRALEVGTDWTRRAPMTPEKGQGSPLTCEGIYAQEANRFTIDTTMLRFANLVQKEMGGQDNDDEAYVLVGCNSMDSSKEYFSEFKTDSRRRFYQACCSGPNGQASDRSRALMNLAGVTLDYDVDTVKKAIRDEVMDMVGVPANQVGKLMTLAVKDPVKFIVSQLNLLKKDRLAKKPWSFVKAALIWAELVKGNKPYIGMAVGLDAKCSGPQLGALMVGDAELSAACGMTLTEADVIDAYERAVVELNKAGFRGFTRNGVKKSFMGIFYGQGASAFTDIKGLLKDENFEVVNILYPNGVVSDDIAKAFHKAITKSFGSKLISLRARFRSVERGVAKGKVTHTMPDGFRVEMGYKVQQNIFGEVIGFEVPTPDVNVVVRDITFKFINFVVNTKVENTEDFIRNGFVNMIQATDALIANLVIVHLKRLGAQHIVAVHDCFRVNVTEMHLLRQAIINAYMDLFGSRSNIKTKDLPFGTDILGMYFEGLNATIATEGEKVIPISQFLNLKKSGQIRCMNKVHGENLVDIIQGLGKSYYFAK